ncbi:hypothetical protein THAOC_08853 [Thalassiosira oceanica]|uniref:Uncharacterized protein n=1 Tax=Thalassiosira oceanica TaxID=159749 RepID=K0T8Y0_THAOC|nr:hypothetical protein THAOC_08853 [Thalassiosira oceanica]|mmetsp:Transcript_15779/g.36343  ORF Transcript_15779/g.36343 Transcript_15779/m.36343 type:complete len:191 (+) Transcript_15779:81-653(+)|eukprot:EJK69851.1 hypothetical protein THAOC_08853 [Thalassiosira oceanica]
MASTTVEPAPAPPTSPSVTINEEPQVNEVEEHVDGDEHDNEDDEAEGDDDDEDDVHEVKEWDEGGKSHCGYGDTVHETLMTIGKSIHGVVGDPSDSVHDALTSVGNWFQEASYAMRDLKQGKMNVGEETSDAIKRVVAGDGEDAEKLDAEGSNEADGEEGPELLTGSDDGPELPTRSDEVHGDSKEVQGS